MAATKRILKGKARAEAAEKMEQYGANMAGGSAETMLAALEDMVRQEKDTQKIVLEMKLTIEMGTDACTTMEGHVRARRVDVAIDEDYLPVTIDPANPGLPWPESDKDIMDGDAGKKAGEPGTTEPLADKSQDKNAGDEGTE